MIRRQRIAQYSDNPTHSLTVVPTNQRFSDIPVAAANIHCISTVSKKTARDTHEGDVT